MSIAGYVNYPTLQTPYNVKVNQRVEMSGYVGATLYNDTPSAITFRLFIKLNDGHGNSKEGYKKVTARPGSTQVDVTGWLSGYYSSPGTVTLVAEAAVYDQTNGRWLTNWVSSSRSFEVS
jgi:hypothetical protein